MKKIILTDDEINKIIELYNSGLGQTKIKNITNISNNLIIRTLKENNIDIIGTKRFSCDENFFDKIDTEEKSYWLGFLFADGYVRIRKDKYGELKLKLQYRDINHIELFKNHINSNNVIKTVDEKYKYKGEIKTTKSSTFSIYSTKIVNDLINLGCTENKSKTIIFPDDLPKELIRHFIRGFFDGDGCVSLYKDRIDLYICCANKEFLTSIKTIFTQIGITKQEITLNINNVYLLRFYRYNDMKRIYDYFYTDSTVFLTRKMDTFNNVNKKIENKYE